MGSLSQIGIVILERSFPIALLRIAQILKLYFSGVITGNVSLMFIVYVTGIPPNPINIPSPYSFLKLIGTKSFSS